MVKMCEDCARCVKMCKDGVLSWPTGPWTSRFILPVTVSVKPKKIRSLEKPRIKNYMSVASL